jgi:DNA-binding NarL/FixJ family response regulator
MSNDTPRSPSSSGGRPVRATEVALKKGDDVFTAVHPAATRKGKSPKPTQPDGDQPAPIHLTPRERDVLRLLVEGHGDAEIAKQLGLSRRTVSEHVSNLLKKFGVATRVALIVRAGSSQ